MAVVFCASKQSIVAQWKNLLTCKEHYVAKSQKDLLSFLPKSQSSPVVFIEKRLYLNQTPSLIKLLLDSHPEIKLLILSHLPTFHEAQAMLSCGAHGYGNVYMAKEWLNDAFSSLSRGENWPFPLQECAPKEDGVVGKISFLDGSIVDELNQPLAQNDTLRANQKVVLLEGRAIIECINGSYIQLQGREPLKLDESVFEQNPKEFTNPLKLPQLLQAKSSKSKVDSNLKFEMASYTLENKKPFYINFGAQSLIAPLSDELEIKPPKHNLVCPFIIEEAKPLEPFDNTTLELKGPIEAYELIHSSALNLVLINDLNGEYEGPSVVCEPIKTVRFSNASVALSRISLKQEHFNFFGEDISFKKIQDKEILYANVEILGGRRGIDYILFDRDCVPEELNFIYSLDDKSIGIYFEGAAPTKVYEKLLKTLKYECANTFPIDSLHVIIHVGTKEGRFLLFDQTIDTNSNIK